MRPVKSPFPENLHMYRNESTGIKERQCRSMASMQGRRHKCEDQHVTHSIDLTCRRTPAHPQRANPSRNLTSEFRTRRTLRKGQLFSVNEQDSGNPRPHRLQWPIDHQGQRSRNTPPLKASGHRGTPLQFAVSDFRSRAMTAAGGQGAPPYHLIQTHLLPRHIYASRSTSRSPHHHDPGVCRNQRHTGPGNIHRSTRRTPQRNQRVG